MTIATLLKHALALSDADLRMFVEGLPEQIVSSVAHAYMVAKRRTVGNRYTAESPTARTQRLLSNGLLCPCGQSTLHRAVSRAFRCCRQNGVDREVIERYRDHYKNQNAAAT